METQQALQAITIPRYPALTEKQITTLIECYNLQAVDQARLRLELARFEDYYTRKPSKAKNPSTFSALCNWLDRARLAAQTQPHPSWEGYEL